MTIEKAILVSSVALAGIGSFGALGSGVQENLLGATLNASTPIAAGSVYSAPAHGVELGSRSDAGLLNGARKLAQAARQATELSVGKYALEIGPNASIKLKVDSPTSASTRLVFESQRGVRATPNNARVTEELSKIINDGFPTDVVWDDVNTLRFRTPGTDGVDNELLLRKDGFQKLVFERDASTGRKQLQRFERYDADGKQIAESFDPGFGERVHYTAPEDGQASVFTIFEGENAPLITLFGADADRMMAIIGNQWENVSFDGDASGYFLRQNINDKVQARTRIRLVDGKPVITTATVDSSGKPAIVYGTAFEVDGKRVTPGFRFSENKGVQEVAVSLAGPDGAKTFYTQNASWRALDLFAEWLTNDDGLLDVRFAKNNSWVEADGFLGDSGFAHRLYADGRVSQKHEVGHVQYGGFQDIEYSADGNVLSHTFRNEQGAGYDLGDGAGLVKGQSLTGNAGLSVTRSGDHFLVTHATEPSLKFMLDTDEATRLERRLKRATSVTFSNDSEHGSRFMTITEGNNQTFVQGVSNL